MLATYYTVLYNYAGAHGFPVPAPEFPQVVTDFEEVIAPVREQVEGMGILANAKSTRQGGDEQRGGLNGRLTNGMNAFRRKSSGQGLTTGQDSDKQGSEPPTPSATEASTPASMSTASRTDYFANAAVKKKPPPPPPRAGSNTLFVTALYDFAGESQGDLAFAEGDRIRVLKKTESTDDWWEGELRGVKGSFPANYVKL